MIFGESATQGRVKYYLPLVAGIGIALLLILIGLYSHDPEATFFIIFGIGAAIVGLFISRVRLETDKGDQPLHLSTLRNFILLLGFISVDFIDFPYSFILPVVVFALLVIPQWRKTGYWLAWLFMGIKLAALLLRALFPVSYVIHENLIESSALTGNDLLWSRIIGLIELIAITGIGIMLYISRRHVLYKSEEPKVSAMKRNLLLFGVVLSIIVVAFVAFALSFSWDG